MHNMDLWLHNSLLLQLLQTLWLELLQQQQVLLVVVAQYNLQYSLSQHMDLLQHTDLQHKDLQRRTDLQHMDLLELLQAFSVELAKLHNHIQQQRAFLHMLVLVHSMDLVRKCHRNMGHVRMGLVRMGLVHMGLVHIVQEAEFFVYMGLAEDHTAIAWNMTLKIYITYISMKQ